MVFSVSMWNNDGGSVPCLTVRRPVTASSHYQWIFSLDFCQSEPRRKADVDRSTYKRRCLWAEGHVISMAMGFGEEGEVGVYVPSQDAGHCVVST